MTMRLKARDFGWLNYLNMFVFDEQVNHVKQNTVMFKLFNLLQSRYNNSL